MVDRREFLRLGLCTTASLSLESCSFKTTNPNGSTTEFSVGLSQPTITPRPSPTQEVRSPIPWATARVKVTQPPPSSIPAQSEIPPTATKDIPQVNNYQGETFTIKRIGHANDGDILEIVASARHPEQGIDDGRNLLLNTGCQVSPYKGRSVLAPKTIQVQTDPDCFAKLVMENTPVAR
ncbi:hypothetical protein M1563_03995 [Patescibacteria group bacterium]|nr:hypothetical protein [Patescibacteria group bacterium]MCL5409509.1 hypothetical protein [Patescibacteria group bacterium]